MDKKEIIETNNDELINQVNYFKNEENELNQTIQEIDNLYDEVKQHYDQLRVASRSGNGGRGILTFIQNQTGNLVALKNSKASLINSKIAMKKAEADIYLKQQKDQDESKVTNEVVNAVLKQLEEDNENTIIEEVDYDEITSSKEEDPDALLEARLQQLKDNGEISDDDLVGDNEGTLAVYVKDKKWHFVGINSAGKIIKGFEVPDKKLFKMKLSTDDDGNKIAIDQDEKIYKVIRPKKKK